ncbi:TM2 domain-containing protein [Bacillus sp. Hm123]|uniref:TM2 domain-containing protein n=1 Tax=Bacillus sp. Hm123 TaxID=3450745 RepID=UPI003F439998
MSNNMLLKRDLTAEQLAIVHSELEKKKKSNIVMYVLWWFTGIVGGHRYYLGDIGYAIGMTLTFGGLGIWALFDVFFIGKRLEKKTEQLETDIIKSVLVYNKRAAKTIQ